MQTEAQVLKHLRRVCLHWPDVHEIVTFGHPTFQVGKRTFAVLETYKGILSIAFKAGLSMQEVLTKDSRFYMTPYVGHRGWLSLRAEGKLNWKEIEGLLLHSYRMAAPKRALKRLDGAAAKD